MKKGVSLLIVVISVSVMAILITSSIIIGSSAINTAQYEEFLSQVNRTSGSVNEYFLEYNKLPVSNETISSTSFGKEFLHELILKEDENNRLQVLDLNLLNDPTIKRGYGTVQNKDVFVVAENTHNIYYLKGFNYKGKAYFGLKANDDYTSNKKLNVFDKNYQRLEYIKSTRTQYIDTGYVPKTNTKIEADVKFSGAFTPESTKCDFFGVLEETNAFAVNYILNSDNDLFVWIDKSNGAGGAINDFKINEDIKFNRNKIIFGSGSIKYGNLQMDLPTKTQNQVDSMLIFGMKYLGNPCTFTAYDMYLYSFKIYEGENLVREYIPCRRKSDNKIGLYDEINEIFYENNGTGEFEGNLSETTWKDLYKKVEYIKSTKTQYIDTGYVPKTNTKVEMDLKFSGNYTPKSNKCKIFGVIDNNNSYSANFGGQPTEGNTLFNWIDKVYEEGDPIYNLNIDDNVRKSRNIFSFGNGTVSYGNFSRTLPNKINNQQLTMVIFGWNSNGEYHAFEGYDMYLYSCKIYEGEFLVRYFVPCYRKVDNVAGIYDIITGGFYTNGGTGNFEIGESVVTPENPSEMWKVKYTPVDYIESTGTQYIDTQISGENGKTVRMEVDFQLTNKTDDRWVAGTDMSFEAGVYSNSFYTRAGFSYSQTNLLSRTTTW